MLTPIQTIRTREELQENYRRLNDARSKVISLTEKTKSMQEQLEEVGTQLDDMMTENLTADEKKQLLSLLQKMMRIDERE